MKIRNKKTGEIAEASVLNFELVVRYDDGRVEKYPLLFDYSNFEYYEEPKDYYVINLWGEVSVEGGKYQRPGLSELGLTFETEEEAEKAVKKLKAWKRLKDKGFRFKEWESYEETSGLSFPDRHIVNSYTAIFDFNKPCRKHEIENEVKTDLDLLFSGGEE